MKHRLQKGFTLVELMVVVSIMGVIFGVIVTASGGIQRRSRDTQRQSDLRNLQSALQQYYADQNFFPISSGFNLSTVTQLQSSTGCGASCPTGSAKTYTDKIPKDPVTSNPKPYIYIAEQTASSAGGCTNGTTVATKCGYYYLCAQLESVTAGSGAAPTRCTSAGYNFGVTPTR